MVIVSLIRGIQLQLKFITLFLLLSQIYTQSNAESKLIEVGINSIYKKRAE